MKIFSSISPLFMEESRVSQVDNNIMCLRLSRLGLAELFSCFLFSFLRLLISATSVLSGSGLVGNCQMTI